MAVKKKRHPQDCGQSTPKKVRSMSGGAGGLPISRRRRWLFSLSAILLPLAVLGVLELGLRIGGYGYRTEYFLRDRIQGEDVLVENSKFGLRFFPPALARSPSPTVIKAVKPLGTYRILLFGESAALGDPRPGYGSGRYLEALLKERFPGTKFEVVCVAMTAISSHAVLPIARECVRYQGDLWIVYMGNNEMIGPFGVGTVLGARAPSMAFIRASLALQTTKVGQLFTAWRERARKGKQPVRWSGMRMWVEQQVRADDPRKKRVYEHFRRNLDDLLREGRRARVPVVVSTVASNLKDCPPFASLHKEGWSESDAASFAELGKKAVNLESGGNPEEAGKAYQEMVKEDARYAETWFRLAQNQFRLGQHSEARQSFALARDYDALAFRTDTSLNQIIRDTATRESAPGVRFCDAAELLARASPEGIPGRELFYEHVHLTFEGNYLLARAFAEQVSAVLPAAVVQAGGKGWAGQETCDQRLSLTDWNRKTAYEDMVLRVSEPPFTSQLGHLAHVKALTEKASEYRTRARQAGWDQTRSVYVTALEVRQNDFRVHEGFAEFLEASGKVEEATAEWRNVERLLPHHQLAYFHLGQLLGRQRKYEEAEAAFAQALKIRPDLAEAYVELGDLLQKQGKLKEALNQLAAARRLRPDDPKVLVKMADALAAQNQRGEAVKALVEAVQLQPSYWEARYLLGVEYAGGGKIREAAIEFEAVTLLRPEHPLGHLNLAVAWAKLGRIEDARMQFRETLRLDPQNKKASQYLNALDAPAKANP
jgi:tetratricopeptide (TPR) repeat protein